MTTIIENRNKKKAEINKIIKILESWKLVDKKTLKQVKNKILSAYYSSLFDEKKENSKNVSKELRRINTKISNTEKKLKEIREKILYIKLEENTKFLWRNTMLNKKIAKDYKTTIASKAKMGLTKKLFGKVIGKITNINNGNNANERKILMKNYKKLKQENTQLKIIRDELIQKDEDNVIFIQNKRKQRNTLKDYINEKSEWWINKVLNLIDSVNIRENDSQKEDLKYTILESYKNSQQNKNEDDIYKMAKSLESYIDENFENIMKDLDWIQEKINWLELRKKKIREKEQSWKIEDIISLKEEEYKIQLEITKLKKDFDEIKYNIEEKLKAYDWSTYEEKKAEILNNNKKNGE